MTKLLTKAVVRRLLANFPAGEDTRPAGKLFTPDAQATWLIADMDPEDPDRLFGLCRAQHNPKYVERSVMLRGDDPAPFLTVPGSDRFT